MVLIIARHFPKSRHVGFDLNHQIELGRALGLLCMTRAGSSGCGAGGQDRDVGVLDLICHGLLERGDAAVDLGDGQTRLEAQHDLDKDDAA
jgi:hypothetical protein